MSIDYIMLFIQAMVISFEVVFSLQNSNKARLSVYCVTADSNNL